MRPIFLIGFMCSGKTTLGRAVSKRAGIRFVDLDEEIERRTGMSVPEIFSQYGEDGFRRIEKETLGEICGLSDVIVACGGGTPCVPGAMELMNESGTTVRLVPHRRRLVRRLMAGRRKRPLIAGIDSPSEMGDFLDFTSALREQHYCKAAHKFDSTRLDSPAEVDETTGNFISLFVK